jgi:hypothetical protein
MSYRLDSEVSVAAYGTTFVRSEPMNQLIFSNWIISAFGKCIANRTNHSQTCTRRSQCEVEKLSKSKFYLAFESTTLQLNYIVKTMNELHLQIHLLMHKVIPSTERRVI